MIDVLDKNGLGVDVVRVDFASGKVDEIEVAIEPTREDYKVMVAALETERSISFVDFDAAKAVAQKVADQVDAKLAAGEYGPISAQGYLVASGRVMAPLPIVQLFIADGKGQQVNDALDAFITGDCS
ncbi:MAG: hypothetical protein AAFO77_00625 [Pseudomonadota bacterium]